MEMIETTIDLSCADINDYVIKAEFDEDLKECKENIDNVTSQFDGVLKKAAHDLGLEAGKTIKLDSNLQLGHYFRITLKVCYCLVSPKITERNSMEEYIFDDTALHIECHFNK